MGPRKRSKPNLAANASIQNAGASTSTSEPTRGPGTPREDIIEKSYDQSTQQATLSKPTGSGTQAGKFTTSSWPYGGSWRGKVLPIAEIFKENAFSGSDSVSKLMSGEATTNACSQSPSGTPVTPGSTSPSQSRRRSSKSVPVTASKTRLNVISRLSEGQQGARGKERPTKFREAEPDRSAVRKSQDSLPQSDTRKDGGIVKSDNSDAAGFTKREEAPSGWLGWWSGPDKIRSDQQMAKLKTDPVSLLGSKDPDAPTLEISAPEGGGKSSEPDTGHETHVGDVQPVALHSQQKIADTKTPGGFLELRPALDQRPRSWLGLWGTSRHEHSHLALSDTASSHSVPNVKELPRPPKSDIPSESNGQQRQSSVSSASPAEEHVKGLAVWNFWSRADLKSSSSPYASRTGRAPDTTATATPAMQARSTESNAQHTSKNVQAFKGSKRGRPKSLDSQDDSSANATTALPSQETSNRPTPSPSPLPGATRPNAESSATRRLQKHRANLLLPEFRDTYSIAQPPSLWQQISQYFSGPAMLEKHVHVAATFPKIKKAVAIGVHGYFPAAMIQKILGQPTGTSLRFAEGAAAGIKKWTDQHGYNCKVEKVALEGEGMISDRVDALWKLLLKSIEHIRQADFVLFACHSQGVPVTIMLIARLIMFGCVPSTRIGVCAMAGVNLGPFIEYKSRYFGGAAAELFEFSKSSSTVSQKYVEALNLVLKHRVRIVYVGSIDDQLVSLESAMFSNIEHPYIYRAVFIDGRIHAPSFVTHLVGFALKLRNLGISDHGLIRELSGPLAGSLYSGEGHSTIYNDAAVYDLAITYALDTTDVGDVPVEIKPYELPVQANPYFLPWAMRGVMEEEYVKKELGREMRALVAEFDEWKPVSKVLKDVKFRLEAVKSKL